MLKTVTFRSTVIAVACALSLSAHAMADAPRKLDVPAGDLVAALESLAKQAEIEIVYQADQMKGLRTHGLTGTFSTQDAVRKLLEGTPLRVRTDESTGAMLIASPTPNGGRPQSRTTPDHSSQKPDHTSKSFWSRFRLAEAQPRDSNGAVETDATGSGEKVALEEVVVTAQKREERLATVPQAVTVLSANTLTKQGLLQFRDYANTIPGVTFSTQGAGFGVIAMRGITVGGDVAPTTGVYVDEVPYTASGSFASGQLFTLDSSLFNVERVEVLRGPQGTLYGASSMSGLVKYISKQPDTERLGVDIQTGVADTQEGGFSYNVGAGVNMPIAAGKAGLHLSGFQNHDGGYIDNIARGEDDVNQSDTYGGRADLLLTPTDELSVRIAAFLQNISRDGTAAADYTPLGVAVNGDLEQRRLIDEPYTNKTRLFSGTINYSFDWVSLTSVSSYQTSRASAVRDLPGFIPVLAGRFGQTFSAVGLRTPPNTDKFTQEVRLTSKQGGTLEWLVGAFYTDEKTDSHSEMVLRDPAGDPAVNTFFHRFTNAGYDEVAGFGDLTWRLSSKFDVTGGVRYSHNQQEFQVDNLGTPLVVAVPFTKGSDDVFTYLANARYHLNDRSIAYVRYATGYRPGGPNFLVLDPVTGGQLAPDVFEADRLKSYEIGFKRETMDRRFAIDLAVYYLDWENIQTSLAPLGIGVIVNATGGARVRGAELALTARPVDGLTLTGAFAHQDAELADTSPEIGGALAGSRLPNVPRFTASVSADYELPFENARPTVGATVRYVSDRMSNFSSVPSPTSFRFPEYTAVDLRGGVALGSIDMQVYVHNLLDKRGLGAGAAGQPGSNSIIQPRTIGVMATTHF
jgi:iron complex outermembrane recepter protein